MDETDAHEIVGPRISLRLCSFWVVSIAMCAMTVHYSFRHALRVDEHFDPGVSDTWWEPTFVWTIVVVGLVIDGTAIAGAALVVYQAICTRRVSDWQPGHLLLLPYGVVAASATMATLMLSHETALPFARSSSMLLHGAVFYSTPLFFVVLAWKWPDRPWKLLFALESMVFAVQIIVELLPPSRTPLPILLTGGFLQGCLVAGVVVALVCDHVRRRSRNWLHWIGVTVVIVSSGISALSVIRVFSYWVKG